MKKIFLFLFLSMILISGASADYLPHKVDTNLKFSITSNFADECLLSTIDTPNDVIVINQLVQDSGTFTFLVSKDNYQELGVYRHNIICNDGVDVVSDVYSREVTLNGNNPPSSGIIIVFSLIFIFIITIGVLVFLRSLDHVTQFNMDLMDTAYMMMTYFGMWFFYYFAQLYLGNPVVNEFLEIAIKVGAFTHIFLALVGFMVSYIMSTLKFKQKARITY